MGVGNSHGLLGRPQSPSLFPALIARPHMGVTNKWTATLQPLDPPCLCLRKGSTCLSVLPCLMWLQTQGLAEWQVAACHRRDSSSSLSIDKQQHYKATHPSGWPAPGLKCRGAPKSPCSKQLKSPCYKQSKMACKLFHAVWESGESRNRNLCK